MARALKLREALFERPFYRLINSEGDGLPGLTIDRFGNTIVVQGQPAPDGSVKATSITIGSPGGGGGFGGSGGGRPAAGNGTAGGGGAGGN